MADPILVALYDEMAVDYERTRIQRFRPFVKRMLQHYDTRPGSAVLDAGCGTGLVSTMVAPRAGHSGRVLGVDASAKMLEIARAKAQGYGFDQCVFVQGDINALESPDGSFDLVICSFALWGEPKALFAEFHRVLKPNGVLLLQNWLRTGEGNFVEFDHLLAAHAVADQGERLAQVRAAQKQHSRQWADMRGPEAYDQTLRDVGFATAGSQVVTNPFHFSGIDELYDFYTVGVRSRLEVAAMDDPTRARLKQAVTAAYTPLVTPKGIDEPRSAIQAIARKGA